MLGPHVIRSTPDALAWSRQAGIVKAVDNIEPLLQAPDSAIRVWRHYLANPDLSDPVGTAFAIKQSLSGYNHRKLYVELWNEEHPSLDQLKVATDCLHTWGYRVAGGSWGTGDYTRADFDIAKQAGCDAIAVHSYWDAFNLTIWEAYRWRVFGYPSSDPPILITECGRRMGGHNLAELLEYDQAIRSDPNVIGATPFTCGPTDDWRSFDVDPLVNQLIQGVSPVAQPSSVSTRWTLGVDVSSFQGTIDWPTLAKTRSFAFIKATEGTTYKDIDFPRNWNGANAYGMIRGAYHFGRPFSNSGAAEAAFFLSHVPKSPGDIPILDLEDDSDNPTADLRAYLIDYITQIKAAWGVPPLIYSRASYLRAHNCLFGPDLLDAGLWLASWSVLPPSDLAGWPFWAVWQHTDHGVVPGINTAVDEDVFHGSFDLLRRYGAP